MPPSEQDGMWQTGDASEGWSQDEVLVQQAPTAAGGLRSQAEQRTYMASVQGLTRYPTICPPSLTSYANTSSKTF